jgi:catechol 2,3-dioxygenase-like lactoylglutathione lyase family enzyme
MNEFRISQIDHVELFVSDRDAAAAWYARTLGLRVVPEYAHWAADSQGPLMVATAEAGTKLALFAGTPQSTHADTGLHRVAFRVSRRDFEAFRTHVRENPVFGEHDSEQGEQVRALAVRDHDAALSVYFRDPDGNRPRHNFSPASGDFEGCPQFLGGSTSVNLGESCPCPTCGHVCSAGTDERTVKMASKRSTLELSVWASACRARSARRARSASNRSSDSRFFSFASLMATS